VADAVTGDLDGRLLTEPPRAARLPSAQIFGDRQWELMVRELLLASLKVKSAMTHRSKLTTLFLTITLAACATESDAPPDYDDDVGGKGDSIEESNQLTLKRGGTTTTINLEDSTDCGIKEFTIVTVWENEDQSDYYTSIFRLGLELNAHFIPQAGQSFELQTEKAHNGFLGPLDPTTGAGCVVEIESYENLGAGSTSHIAVNYDNCDLGSGASVSGRVACSGLGFKRVWE
jgi:hypothetical protein